MARSEQKKQAALEALMESNTLTEAAERAGISRRTLYTYIREDHEFAYAYRTIQECSILLAADHIQENQEKASDVILSIMSDENQPASARLSAARIILDQAGKQSERALELARIAHNESSPLSKYLSF